MDVEIHQLDLRYETLRKRSPRRERQLMASLAEVGQLLPIVVVRGEAADRYVVVDGYKRVRAARRLRWDTVAARIWEIGEADALLLERMMRTGDPEGGWSRAGCCASCAIASGCRRASWRAASIAR